MESKSPVTKTERRSVWLGVLVGWLAQLGLTTLLPIVTIVAGQTWAMATGVEVGWVDQTQRAMLVGWLVIQLVVFGGSVVAGAVGAYLAPRRSWAVPLALVLLSLLASVFQQLPWPRSTEALLIWMLGPCVGSLTGIAIVWRLGRNNRLLKRWIQDDHNPH
jgi:hypothetical protein